MYISRNDIGAWGSFGFGEAAPALSSEEGLQAFQAAYLALRKKIVDANKASEYPLSQEQLDTNLAALDRAYQGVLAGNYGNAANLVRAARGVLAGVGVTYPDSTFEDLFRSIQELPAQIQRAVVAAGQTAGDALRAAGVDPEKVTEGVTDTLKLLGLAVGGTIALVVLHKLGVFSKAKTNPRRRRIRS